MYQLSFPIQTYPKSVFEFQPKNDREFTRKLNLAIALPVDVDREGLVLRFRVLLAKVYIYFLIRRVRHGTGGHAPRQQSFWHAQPKALR